VAAVGALAIAVPAMAHPGHPNHPSSNHPSHSHKCKPRNAAYIVSGTVDSTTSLTPGTTSGTWSGTLAVDVTSTNHRANGDKTATQPVDYTLSNTKVRFDGGTSAFVAGERVKLIGKLAVVAKKCPALSPASTPVFRMVVVHPAPTS
jgi:hypothetical protein